MISSLLLVTVPAFSDWQQVLSPPYEVVPLTELVYVSDAGDDHKRPFRTLTEGGDCEDFAIAEYHARAARGETGMLLVVGWEPVGGFYHAVLYDDGYVDRTGRMSPYFRPIYAVDEHGSWLVRIE